MADFPAIIRLAKLDGSNGFRLNGIDGYDRSGSSVASAGDVNGDGFDDIIIGAYGAPSGPYDVGESYVVFGSGDEFPADFNLAALDGNNGFRLGGIDTGEKSGWSVSSAGDINGDGFYDIIIGAIGADTGGINSGRTYIVFGKPSGFAPSFDLAALDGANGFRINGLDSGDESGRSVSSAGDVNGDGFDDMIIGASGADTIDDFDAGSTYVVFGKAGGFGASFDLATLDGNNGFRVDGIDENDYSGASVSSAGDVNGDGFDDIIIGASSAGTDDYSFEGESYVVFGGAGGFGASIDLATLDGTNGFRLDGVDMVDRSGRSVSRAGDVNGDGFGDIIIGATGGAPGGASYAGESYVVFGKTGGFAASVDLSTLDGTNGFRLDGIGVNDVSGVSVSSAGDVNGDGFDDVLIGAMYAGPGSDYGAGESYVVFGKADGFAANIDLATLDGANGFRVRGIDDDDHSGASVASAGDLNGDGFDDIIIGAPYADRTNDFSFLVGESYVIFGRAPTEAVLRVGSSADQVIRGGDFDDTLVGKDGDDTLIGAGGGDMLSGVGGDDQLKGGAGADELRGGRGDDRLIASVGRDALRGGGGDDVFVLSEAASGSERPRILDFISNEDEIKLVGNFGLPPGRLDPDAFAANATGSAEDAQDRLIYDTVTGRLFFDPDGDGSQDGVLLAKFNGAPGLAAGDIVVARSSSAAPLAIDHRPLPAHDSPFADMRAPDLLIA